MLNRREQLALLLLTGSLLVGTIVSAVDRYRPEMMEDFHVIPAAVPAPGAATPAADETAPRQLAAAADRVDVNAASAAELEALPRIGPATAARILEYRRAHGDFVSLDDLRHVSGIGERTVEQLRPHAEARPSR